MRLLLTIFLTGVSSFSSAFIIDAESPEELLKTAQLYNDLYQMNSTTEKPKKNLFIDYLEGRTHPQTEIPGTTAEERAKGFPKIDEANPPPPVVFMHGLMDAGIFDIGFCEQVKWKYNTHTKCLNVADLLASAYVNLDSQLNQMTRYLQEDKILVEHSKANNNQGFYLVGISQGGILSKAYIERVNAPNVKRFVSWTGVQNGIATCPAGFSPKICNWFENGLLGGPYNCFLAFSDYWRDPTDKKKYLRF